MTAPALPGGMGGATFDDAPERTSDAMAALSRQLSVSHHAWAATRVASLAQEVCHMERRLAAFKHDADAEAEALGAELARPDTRVVLVDFIAKRKVA